MTTLDEEEQEILSAFESGRLKRAKNADREMVAHREAAAASIEQDIDVSLRLSLRDVRALKAKALHDGLPYQALASSILHKFAEGRLTEQS